MKSKAKIGLVCQLHTPKLGFNSISRGSLQKLIDSGDMPATLAKMATLYHANMQKTLDIVAHIKIHNPKITAYRLSSSLFPFADASPLTLQKLFSLRLFSSAISLADALSQLAHQATTHYAPRLSPLLSTLDCVSSHPDHFVRLVTDNSDALDQSLYSLAHTAAIHDNLGLPQSPTHPINLHLQKFPTSIKNFAHDVIDRLPSNVLSRLTFENEDRGTVTTPRLTEFVNSLRTYLKYDAPRGHICPIVYDWHHALCNDNITSRSDLETHANSAASTWQQGLRPVCHWSNGKIEAHSMRAHADMPVLPCKILDKAMSRDCVLEIELKHKNLACQAIADYFYP